MDNQNENKATSENVDQPKKGSFIVKAKAPKKEKAVEKDNRWLGRNLDNYKKQHAALAESKGVAKAFMGASTLTEAKKILKGKKV